MSTGLRHGYRATLKMIAGLEAALLVQLAIVFAGLGALLAASTTAFSVMKFAGAGYLVWLGVQKWRAPVDGGAEQAADTTPSRGLFLQGLLVNLTNPKAILFYVSFFVQFIDFSYAHTWISYLVLAGMLEAMSFVYLTLLIFGGTLMARFFRQRQTAARLGNGLIGLFFMGFAARLATLSS